MFNILVFIFHRPVFVFPSLVAALEGFKGRSSKRILNGNATALDKRCDISVGGGCLIQCEYFSDVYIRKILSAVVYGCALHGSHNKGGEREGYSDALMVD